MAFDPKYVAEITINGMRYRDWESVLVKRAEGENADSFRLTVSEGQPLSKDFAAMRIKPGDHCTITLAGELAITGYVETRQVAYTADQHGIEIIGHSQTKAAGDASAMTKTGEFRDKNVSQIAQSLLKPHGIGWKEYGPVNKRPFPRVNIAPGESVWNTIDMLVRQRGGWLGSDVDGSMHIRTQWDAIGDALIEGVNILEGRETMTISQGGGGVDGKGVDVTDTQKSGNNNEWGAKVAHDPSGQADKTIELKLGNKGVHAPVRTIAEHPGGKQDAKDRATKEADKRGAESLVVQIVVLGWLKPSGGLWKPGDKIHIKSPMLIIDEMMDLTSATFTQDSKSGTRTTLEFKRGEGGAGDVQGKGVDVTPQSSTGQTSGLDRTPGTPD